MSGECNIPFPGVRVNNDLDITQYNQYFQKWIDSAPELNNIKKLVPDYKQGLYKQTLPVGEEYYDIYSVDEKDCTSIVFVQNRNIDAQGHVASNVLICLLLLDNYAEVEENTDELRLPHLFAVIERKVNDYVNTLGGIVRKFERDKFLIVLNADLLEELKNTHFPIVDQISSIEMGNIPVTVSLGIGYNGNTISEDMLFARSALDLALSRGGNQIVIKKSDDQYEYFGGDGKEVIKNSRVRGRVKAYGFTELILSSSDVMVMGHKNPDLDSLGSASGVFSIANFYGKTCHIVLNEVTSAVKPLYDKLSNDSRYGDAFITSGEALSLLKRKTLVVVVDTHRTMLTECPELLEKTDRIVLFDHHRKCADSIENYVLSYHEAYASSAAELITEMIMYTKGVKPTKDELDGLLAGMTVDTKNFAFKTGVKTFEAASYLKKLGADSVAVRRLFKTGFDDYLARTEIVRGAEIKFDNMAFSVLERETENPVVLIAMAADELLSIEGIEAGFVFYDDKEQKKVCISARSLGGINVQKLMEKLGGGGHQMGAAVQIPDISLDEAKKLLDEKIIEYIEETKK